ncbi:hypothetical protein [Idiomarina abyssalis]|uniref:hypothetical protein n=1 Tax=Idiomarina abyssalis TaxID=86102 RepID=UPI003A94C174
MTEPTTDQQADPQAESTTGVKVDLPEGIDPTLNELFSRDPLHSWSKADRIRVIQHLRETRKIFAREDSVAKTKGKRANAKKAIATKGTGNISLGDLGLDL